MVTPPYIPIFLPKWDKSISRVPEPGLQLGGIFPAAACDLGSPAVSQVLQPQ